MEQILFQKWNFTQPEYVLFYHTGINGDPDYFADKFNDITQAGFIFMKTEIPELSVETVADHRNRFKTDTAGVIQ
jgi:hypothetical protein